MSIHRFYVPPKQIINGNVFIRGTDVWHINKVLRLSKGEQVIVFDGTGHEYRVVLGKRKSREILGTVVEQWERHAESPLYLTLVQGIPKANKMDVIVQKASEIGVNVIVPLQTERSVLNMKQKKLNEESISKKLDRWTRIGIEAVKQSGRTAIPQIQTLVNVEEFLIQPLSADLKLLLWEEEQQNSLKHVLRTHAETVRSAVIVIGPEGGFTKEEAGQFMAQGYQTVSLGKRILRTETAGLVVLGILQYEYGDLSRVKNER
jgi:16S rRNA (uracil1498-N3)-methyltransferase